MRHTEDLGDLAQGEGAQGHGVWKWKVDSYARGAYAIEEFFGPTLDAFRRSLLFMRRTNSLWHNGSAKAILQHVGLFRHGPSCTSEKRRASRNRIDCGGSTAQSSSISARSIFPRVDLRMYEARFPLRPVEHFCRYE